MWFVRLNSCAHSLKVSIKPVLSFKRYFPKRQMNRHRKLHDPPPLLAASDKKLIYFHSRGTGGVNSTAALTARLSLVCYSAE